MTFGVGGVGGEDVDDNEVDESNLLLNSRSSSKAASGEATKAPAEMIVDPFEDATINAAADTAAVATAAAVFS